MKRKGKKKRRGLKLIKADKREEEENGLKCIRVAVTVTDESQSGQSAQ